MESSEEVQESRTAIAAENDLWKRWIGLNIKESRQIEKIRETGQNSARRAQIVIF